MKVENWQPYSLKNYKIETIKIKSVVLKNNPLKDPVVRLNPVLSPLKFDEKELPFVFILSGFGSNAPNYLSPRSFEPSFAQVIDNLSFKIGLRCRFVFIDAWTTWGGSQFINSKAMGNYEDYIVKELLIEIKKHYKTSQVAVFGGSSGGYGALHLASQYPAEFNYAVAIAPDSYFEQSLVPELLGAYPFIKELGGVSAIKKLLDKNEFMFRKEAHSILNAIAMSLCYSSSGRQRIEFPVEWPSGKIKKESLKKWLKHDPIYFLKSRAQKIKKTKGVYLSVGKKDQFCLQYGTEQIYQVLNELGVKCEYNRFNGNHFDISDERPKALKWLAQQFKNS